MHFELAEKKFMNGFRAHVHALGLATACITLVTLPSLLNAQHYKQTNLVSDIPGMAATTDTKLVNAWGISRSSGTPLVGFG